MRVPLLGRLQLREYAALVFGLLLLIFEAFARIVTILLPDAVEKWFYETSRSLFHVLAPAPYAPQDPVKLRAKQIRNARDFQELCGIYGYTTEDHLVQTKDGYLLVVHRLPSRKGEARARPGTPTGKPVVYLHHGLLMCSEVWVCLTDEERCLPFLLAEQGYDVWLGNNRGNKYSRKSVHHTPSETAFWRFSMDEFCMHDIPDTIDYILDITKQPSLGYVGFSQGTAQAFAALSVHPQLNQRVNVFVAIAPAMSPPGLSNNVVDALMKASPSLMFLLFGRRSILSSATFWQSILYPPLFCMIIDHGLRFLFDWKCYNITEPQKMAAYAHLYSFTSTKSVVHWFQIMRRAVFQLYDDDVASAVRLYGQNFYSPAKFPTQNIATPIVLLYGASDSLVDIAVMKKALPEHTVSVGIPAYEHVDMIWGKDVDTLVIPHVLEALEGGRKGRKMAITNGTT